MLESIELKFIFFDKSVPGEEGRRGGENRERERDDIKPAKKSGAGERG